MHIRKSRNRILAGVAAGLAEHQKMNVGFVRLVWFLAGFFTGGIAVGVYVLLAFLMPPPSSFDLDDFREN